MSTIHAMNPDHETTPAFQPFAWVGAEGQKFPGTRLAERTRDISQGIAMVLEMIEQDGLSAACHGIQRLMTDAQQGVMLRFAISAADSLADQAADHCAWVEKHGADWKC